MNPRNARLVQLNFIGIKGEVISGLPEKLPAVQNGVKISGKSVGTFVNCWSAIDELVKGLERDYILVDAYRRTLPNVSGVGSFNSASFVFCHKDHLEPLTEEFKEHKAEYYKILEDISARFFFGRVRVYANPLIRGGVAIEGLGTVSVAVDKPAYVDKCVAPAGLSLRIARGCLTTKTFPLIARF